MKKHQNPALLLIVLATGACTGAINGGNSGSGSDTGSGGTGTGGNGNGGSDPGGTGGLPSVLPENCDEAPAPFPTLRRLSQVEYRNTLKALLPSMTLPQIKLANDPIVSGIFDNDTSILVASPSLVTDLEQAAFSIAAEAIKTPGNLVSCATAPSNESACGRTFIETFGAQALRRPLSTQEVELYVGLFEAQRTAIDFQGALQLTLTAFLQAPEFLYREEGATLANGASLDGYMVASRLSYLIWQSMPDAELFAAAKNGQLATSAAIATQARRLMADPRARAMTIDFHRNWGQFDSIYVSSRGVDIEKDATLYPDWSPAMQAAIREESDRFVGDVMFDQEGSFADLMQSRDTWVNADLAKLYGVPAPSSGWQRVSLNGNERAGFLTRANFLASHSHSTNKSPILRGVRIMYDVFCEEALPDPPDNADLSNPGASTGTTGKTNRQLFAERTSAGVCNACHQTINQFGFALENYDTIGRFETKEGSLDIDASGAIKGTDAEGAFTGPVDYSARIAASTQARQCYTRRWFQFANQRDATGQDACRIGKLADSFREGGYGVADLITQMVEAPEFRTVVKP